MRTMKESGIGWVHAIPDNWKVIKGKYVFTNDKEIVGARVDNFERLALTLNGVIKRSKDDNEGLQPEKFNTYQVLRENELVFKLIDLQNISTSRVGLSPYLGIVSPAYIILKGNDLIYPAFAEKYYLMMWMYEVFNALGDSGVRSSLNSSELLELLLPLPPYDEQIRIADYLDKKNSNIDAVLEDLQEQISLLEKHKKTIVIEKVLARDDSSIKTSNSGIDYIGDIPENWTVKRGKYLFKYIQKPVRENDGVITCFRDGEVTLRSKRREDGFTIAEKEIGYQGIDEGDLIIHGMDGFAGAIGISDSRGKASPVLNVLETNQSKKYYMYYLRAMAYRGVFIALSTGIRIRTCDTNWRKLRELFYLVPPLDVQNRISDYLDEKCGAIDDIIKHKKEQISNLVSLKKTIMYEYVTGKKEVLANE